MKQKINLLLITMLLTLCLSACGKQSADQTDVTADRETLSEAEGPETDKTEKEDTAPEQTAAESAEGFDMERIRKSIIIKGQPFELPTALCDLGEGWTWEEYWVHPNTGGAIVDVYYNGEELFGGSVENYYEGAEEQAIIYNLTIRTDDSSIDDLVPGKTTKQEVTERYGEPTGFDGSNGGYIYGTEDNKLVLGEVADPHLTISFDESGVIRTITITYYVDIAEQVSGETAESFDIERVRKSIIIKGYPVEVPTALYELGEGWTWEEELALPSGAALITLYHDGKEWYTVALENYFEGAEEQGILSNLTIDTDDTSMDGLIPKKSTKQEVVDRYGEPATFAKTGAYVYGTTDFNPGSGEKVDSCIVVVFDENDVIDHIIINYLIEE